MIRPLIPKEISFSLPDAMSHVQLAVKFTDSSYIPKAVRNFEKIFYSLRLRIENNCFIKQNQSSSITKLPDWIDDCKTAAKWMEYQTKPYSEVLATLAANDKIVAITSSHSASDGGFCVRALQHVLSDDLGEIVDCGESAEVVFEKEMKEARENVEYNLYSEAKACNIPIPPHNAEFYPVYPDSFVYQRSFPVSKLQVYDEKTKCPKRLTESLLLSSALSIMAYSKVNVNGKISIPTVFDLRRLSKRNLGWRASNYIASPVISAHYTPSDSLDTVLNRLGMDIKKCMKEGRMFNYLAPKPEPYNSTKTVAVVSNLGPIRFSKPVVDFHAQSTSNGSKIKWFSILSFSKVNESGNTLNMVYNTNRRFVPDDITTMIGLSINHMLTDVPLSTSVQGALNDLSKFQKKYSEL